MTSHRLLPLIAAALLLALPTAASAATDLKSVPSPANQAGNAANHADVLHFDLQTAVARALAVNPGLKASGYRQQAADEQAKAARGELLPTITTSAGLRRLHNLSDDESNQDYLDQQSTSYSVRLSQPLFAGFTALNTWRRAGLEADQAGVRREMHRLDLAHEVQVLFLELIRIREDLRGAESAVERLEAQMAAAEAWFEVEMRPRLDVLQTRSELETARNRLSSIAGVEQKVLARLAARLALPPGTVAEYDDQLWRDPPQLLLSQDQLLAAARDHRPDLDLARLAVDLADSQRRLARGRFAPRVTLDLDYTRQDIDYRIEQAPDLDREYWSAGINMQWELFSGGRDYYQNSAAGHDLSAARAQLRDAENQLAAEIRQALLAHAEAEAQISGAREAVNAAREAHAMARERFAAGLGTTTEVLETQDQLTRTETDLNRVKVERLLSLADVYRAAGLFKPELR